ncbi:MAG: cyclic nucleotide-binding domain-containing protein [Deltaproteobacteria bacterium]|nr:cyclic nucleotide-binding domain-containing protein [Deltaproteobacteria bacterium]
MTDNNFIDIINNSYFFRALTGEQIALIAARARMVSYPGGQLIASENQVSNNSWLLVNGEIAIFRTGLNDDAEIIKNLKPGALFGKGPIIKENESANFKSIGHVTLLTWDSTAIEAILDQDKELKTQLAVRLSLTRRYWELVDLLKKSHIFRGVSPSLLQWMLESSTLVKYNEGQWVCHEGESADCLYLIANGSVEILSKIDQDNYNPIKTLFAGNCFGEISLINNTPKIASVRALRRSEIIIIGKKEFDDLCRHSKSFRQNIGTLSQKRLAVGHTTQQKAELIWMINRTSYNTGVICYQIKQALERCYNERTGVVYFSDSQEIKKNCPDDFEIKIIDGKKIPVSREIIFKEYAGKDTRYILVFSDKHLEPAIHETLSDEFALSVFLTHDMSDPFPYSRINNQFVKHVLIMNADHKRCGIVRRGSIRLDLTDLPVQSGFADLGLNLNRRFERLARLVTRRLVGVALGGGGAWGYGHVALMRRLSQLQIPVDFLAGSSFGSVIGCCYASKGLDGLDMLIDLASFVGGLAKKSHFTMTPLGKAVAKFLNHTDIDEMETPIYTVSLDIRRSTEKIFRQGRICSAVSASCAFPGLFAPFYYNNTRYIDGGVINNVPASVVAEEGADFILASNVVPLKRPFRAEPQKGIKKLISRYSPFGRLMDVEQSLYLFLGHAGERQANGADFYFSPDLSRFSSGDYKKAKDIIKKADEDFETILNHVKERYRVFCAR